MSAGAMSALAFSATLAALLSDWVCSELFMGRDTVANVCLALLLNATLVGLLLMTALRLTSARVAVATLRLAALVGFSALIFQSLRADASPGQALPFAAKAGGAMVVVLLAVYAVRRLPENIAKRLTNAVMFASFAFIASPFVLRTFEHHRVNWMPAPGVVAPTVPGRRAVMFLLLDELGHPAAAPLAQALRDAGLNVSYQSLTPIGANTLNVIPAMFARRAFDQARPCGMSTLCDGAYSLDFSLIRAGRPDIDVTGLLHPYCDIEGLRSCYRLALPHEYGNAYTSLLAFYARRLGLSLPKAMMPPPFPDGFQGQLVARQVAFVDTAPFWREGGVMYAHLGIPHPPGQGGVTTLDRDYASNIDTGRVLLSRWAGRLRAEFGENFSLVVTSDHPLRGYWCNSGVYKLADCKTRSEFQTDLVPLIVASPTRAAEPTIQSNVAVFDVLREQVQRVLR